MKGAVILAAVYLVAVAGVIAYTKIVIPWIAERAWRKANIQKNANFAAHLQARKARIAAAKNGRTERNVTGTPLSRKAGGK